MKKLIVKICRKHGKLEEWQTKKEKNMCGNQVYRCHLCKIEKDQRWKRNNRQKHIDGTAKWKKNNRLRVNEWCKMDREKNPEKYREWARIGRERIGILRSIQETTRLKGINLEQYYALVGSQDNKCGICNRNETRKNRAGNISRLCIDHDHKTGKVRELLCSSCNIGISKFDENVELIKKAISYLERHSSVE